MLGEAWRARIRKWSSSRQKCVHNQEDENEHDMFIPSPLGGEMVDVDHDLLQDMLRDVEDLAQNERDGMKFSRLVSDSETPLYAGCKAKHTKLSVTLNLMKVKASSGWTDKSFTDLLGILKAMHPVENTLPETTYEAKQVLCPLGLEVRRIHACPNDCILYHKQYADLDACPVCKVSRYKRKKSADEGNKSKRGGPAKVVWYLPIIDRFKRIFANPNEAKLVRWHATERRNDGPRQPGNDIDVFLEPVIDDLEILWKESVETWDAYGQENFKLRVLLFCTINDYPALGNLSGQTIKGKKACSDCKEHPRNRWLKKSRKMVYMGHRRLLPVRHTFRRKKKIFNGKRELQPAPKDLSGDEVHNMVKDISNEFGKKRKRSKTKEKEKNVCESLVGLMLNIPGKTKDGLNARLDLQDMNIRSELQPKRDAEIGKVYLPPACHTLSEDEKIAMLSCLKDIKVPSGYSARISKYVKLDDLKLVGMKSHDCHVLITQILPVAIRGILPPKVRHTIQRLCAFFNAIGQKVIDPEDLDGLQTDIVNTLCHLEMFFPLSFFDIMVHLSVHLVKQTKLCGPAFLREMWPFERYMGVLKSYIRSRAKPEGSIIKGYTTEEAIEFCVNYMSDADPIGVPASRHEGRLSGVGTIGRKRIRPDQASYVQAHYAVLQHMAEVVPYFEEHLAKIRDENLGRSDAWINREHNSRFNEWFKNRVTMSTDVPNETVQLLGMGPSWTIDTWQGYDINGYTFYTVKQDDKSTVQNSGVRIDAFQDQVGSNTYYGRIEEIWELNYVKFKVPLFHCRWVNLRTSVKADKEGFTLVDLSKVGYADEPFVLAKQVEQIFYTKDPSNKKMHIVRDGKRQIVGVDNVVDEEEYNHNLHVRPHIDLDDDPQESVAYARSDHTEGITL
uniref:OSJNBb0096E05.3 protein n=1 Tax=Oryza sativa subsp. japonica TaxID=39947 RepID=Q7XW52_ORYSJ|nr:OSJNBb0096E05.3 [Oryza sativa Japonica Group]